MLLYTCYGNSNMKQCSVCYFMKPYSKYGIIFINL